MKSCDGQNAKVKKFLEGSLMGEETQQLKSHFLQCDVCRKLILRKDPLFIFSLLSQQKKEEHFWNGYWDPIREKIAVRKKWFEWLGFIRPLPATAVLSSLLLVTAFFLFIIISQTYFGPVPTVEVNKPEDEVVEKMVLTSPLPIVEGNLLPTAKIVTVSVGTTDIVMIFDENMDI